MDQKTMEQAISDVEFKIQQDVYCIRRDEYKHMRIIKGRICGISISVMKTEKDIQKQIYIHLYNIDEDIPIIDIFHTMEEVVWEFAAKLGIVDQDVIDDYEEAQQSAIMPIHSARQEEREKLQKALN